uniref:Uncharacterized protein n=1 Tax=Oryza sativa subsp. japonica TaxID=39947 RepID=Q6K5U1_ORYSJ|nr:hypothetical protein [Oryza sativa Japonica Group]
MALYGTRILFIAVATAEKHVLCISSNLGRSSKRNGCDFFLLQSLPYFHFSCDIYISSASYAHGHQFISMLMVISLMVILL